MFGEERKSQILTDLIKRKSVSVKPLARRFGVAEETIRRDLNALEAQGVAIRTHGGAIISPQYQSQPEPDFGIREKINAAGKQAIGKLAATLVDDGDTLFIDGSSTCVHMAPHLVEKKHLTIVTNSVRLLLDLAPCEGFNLISTGGILRRHSLDFGGESAERSVLACSAGKAFVSSTGFDPKVGATSSMNHHATMQRLMMQRAKRPIYLCDHTKFGKVGYSLVSQIKDIDTMITDQLPPKEWVDILKENNVDLKVVQTDA